MNKKQDYTLKEDEMGLRKDFRKKGQVTIFVILGLIVLITVGLLIYIMNSNRDNGIVRPNIEVDEQFKPVQDYVESCQNQLMVEGITKIGQHGGYIDPSDLYLSGRLLKHNQVQQHNSDVAFMSTYDKNSSVAYWFYSVPTPGCDNCLLGSATPSITEMEIQLEKYINSKMKLCLNNFAAFGDRGFIIVGADNYTASVSITDDGVVSLMEGDVFIRVDNDEGKISTFYASSDIPLRKYYIMATEITVSEIENNYLGSAGLYLLNMHSALDSKRLPPIHELTEGYDIVLWSKTSVRNLYEGLLTSYIPIFRVPNTANYMEVDTQGMSPSEKYYYNATILDFFNHSDLSRTEISFAYMGQDIFMDIKPSDGELLRPVTDSPTDFSFMTQGRIINNYNFYYEISYPVIVEVRDEYKPGNTFTFMFALEGIIRDNRVLRDYFNETTAPIFWDESLVHSKLNKPDTSTSGLSGYNLDNRFAGKVSSSEIDAYINKVYSSYDNKPSLFCNENQRTSRDVTLRTYDSVTGETLPEVKVTFGCGDYVECDMGRSKFNPSTQESTFKSKFPVCKNGYIKLSMEGYLTENILLSTDKQVTQNLGSVYLDPIIEKEFTLQAFDVTKTSVGFTVNNMPRNVTENESIIISLDKVLTDNLEEPYAQTAVVSKEFGSTDATMRLVPGLYKVNIQLIDAEGVYIPKECKRICTGGSNTFDSCVDPDYIPKNDIEIKPAPWGGVEYSNRTLLAISPSDISADNVLQFNVIKMPDPLCIDDMSYTSEIPEISEKNRFILMPRFVVR